MVEDVAGVSDPIYTLFLVLVLLTVAHADTNHPSTGTTGSSTETASGSAMLSIFIPVEVEARHCQLVYLHN